MKMKNRREVKRIIVHCSATQKGRWFTAEDIRRWHKGRGFNDIGYHWVVYLDGTVHAGRAEGIAGAHCAGHNSDSIGICYIGGCGIDGKTPEDTRTEAQKRSIRKLVRELQQRYPGATVHGHNEFAAKACPCFCVKAGL